MKRLLIGFACLLLFLPGIALGASLDANIVNLQKLKAEIEKALSEGLLTDEQIKAYAAQLTAIEADVADEIRVIYDRFLTEKYNLINSFRSLAGDIRNLLKTGNAKWLCREGPYRKEYLEGLVDLQKEIKQHIKDANEKEKTDNNYLPENERDLYRKRIDELCKKADDFVKANCGHLQNKFGKTANDRLFLDAVTEARNLCDALHEYVDPVITEKIPNKQATAVEIETNWQCSGYPKTGHCQVTTACEKPVGDGLKGDENSECIISATTAAHCLKPENNCTLKSIYLYQDGKQTLNITPSANNIVIHPNLDLAIFTFKTKCKDWTNPVIPVATEPASGQQCYLSLSRFGKQLTLEGKLFPPKYFGDIPSCCLRHPMTEDKTREAPGIVYGPVKPGHSGGGLVGVVDDKQQLIGCVSAVYIDDIKGECRTICTRFDNSCVNYFKDNLCVLR